MQQFGAVVLLNDGLYLGVWEGGKIDYFMPLAHNHGYENITSRDVYLVMVNDASDPMVPLDWKTIKENKAENWNVSLRALGRIAVGETDDDQPLSIPEILAAGDGGEVFEGIWQKVLPDVIKQVAN